MGGDAEWSGLRVVLAAKFDDKYHHTGPSIAAALRGCGCEVTTVDLRRRGMDNLPFRSVADRMRRAISLARPDLVLTFKGAQIIPDMAATLRAQHRARWINWYPDAPQNLSESIANGVSYDRVFLIDSTMVTAHHALGRDAGYLALGFDPARFHRVPDAGDPLPIVFIGSAEPGRDRLLHELRDMGLRCYGPRQEGGPLYGNDQNRILSRARIAVNVHQYFGEVPADRYGAGANQRFFELAGIGVTQLCDYKADLPHHFVDGKEIVLYANAAELKERARELLSDETRARAIGDAAHRRAMSEHTWRHRVRELLTRGLSR